MLQQEIFAKMPCPLMCTSVGYVLATDSYWDQSQRTTSTVKRNPTKQIITDVTMADGRRMPVPVFVMSAAPTVRGCIGRYIWLLHLRQQVPGISLYI